MKTGDKAARHQYNLLLIEEDPKQTDLYTDLIREVADCQVDVIASTDSSLEWFNKSNYHLVIIDLPSKVPENESLNVLEKIRRTSPMTSVIIMANNATVDQAVAAIRMGAEDYLKKPFNLESFQLAVKRGLDRKMVFSENESASGYVSLINSCQMVSASLEEEKIFGIVKSYISRELNSNHSAIYSLVGDDQLRLDDTSDNETGDRAMEEILDIALQASNPLPKLVQGNEVFRFIERGQLTPGLFIFRFSCAGDRDYFCICLSPEKPDSLEVFESKLRILKAQIELTGKNIEKYKGVQNLVYVDDATGLYNTRYLHNILDREIGAALPANKSFAVLFMDADKFKTVNDTYGHLIGTKLLHELGHQLKKYVRETDTVFRYGGDEFVAVLSPCDLQTAKIVAERIRKSVEQTSFLGREGLNVRFTVSIGVALFPEHAKTKKDIIDAADQAMYNAKRTTRNSVFIAQIGRSNADKDEQHG